MDYRKIFDAIPEEFDKWRPRYCDELFADMIELVKLDSSKTVLEIGPGTGQATEPILKTDCSYLAVELGENFAEFMNIKYKSYDNFKLVNSDFELYDFEKNSFDLVYSAAAFQWIKESIGYPKVYSMLKSGGVFATFGVASGMRVPALEAQIQAVYAKYWKPEFDYDNYIKSRNSADELDRIGKLKKYGFVDVECRHYSNTREFNAEDYVSYMQTSSGHISLKEPYKSKIYNGIRDIILSAGDRATLEDDIILHIAKKP
jgi:ubiquinone/menaquinone biosynthesis C-methylase UbiE